MDVVPPMIKWGEAARTLIRRLAGRLEALLKLQRAGRHGQAYVAA